MSGPLVLLVGAAVAMLTLVALASRGPGPEQGGRASAGEAGTVSVAPTEYIVLLFLIGAVAATLLLVIALLRLVRPRKKEDEELIAARVPAPWWQGPLLILLIAAVVATAIGTLVWASHQFPSQAAQPSNGTVGAGGSAEPGGGGPSGAATSGAWDWTPVAVVAGAAVLMGVLLVLTRERHASPATSTREHRDEVIEVVEESIEDLRRDPDPRHAVIAAYVRMESVLAKGGWPRRLSAAPLEYLEQALQRFSVPAAPARELTELFEIARFSRDRIDPATKERAIDALLAVQQALADKAA